MKICICGGGNLGHVVAGYLSAKAAYRVGILTGKPTQWSDTLEIVDCHGNTFLGKPSIITSSPQAAIGDADVVLFCLPGFAIPGKLREIAPWLKPTAWVGSVVSSTGFFFEAFKTLPAIQPLFGFQRVPFISRIVRYGEKAELKGYKESLKLAVENTNDKEAIRAFWENAFDTKVTLLQSYYEVSLSNSNPLLHPSRLYTLWRNWEEGVYYDEVPMFYEGWSDEASRLLIMMDNELQSLLEKLPVTRGSITPILDYYESHDAASLTRKISSIVAFKGIKAPMVSSTQGFIPDFNSRYFTEDIPFGMRFIVETAAKYHHPIPVITKVYEWGMSCIKAHAH